MPAPHYRQRLKHLDDLLHINYQKLAEFERELAITADTSKSFELKTKIKEIKAVIEEHETEYDRLEAKLSGNTPTDPVQPPPTPPPVSDSAPLPLKPTFKNSLGMDFVLIPAGSFLMGSPDTEAERLPSEGPQHKVTFSKPFYLGKFQVTQVQWQAVMGNNPSYFKGDTLPVEQVSWDACQEFLKKLNAKKDGYLYRLPSEAEWEYACRAGTTTPFSFGETITTDQVNYDGNYPYGKSPKGEYRQKTTPVGSFPANAWGLHDMHGNVWEWCQDWFQDTYAGAPDDGSARESGSDKQSRVMRGGSWNFNAWFCRSANRDWFGPGNDFGDLGFRVVAARTLTT